MTRRTRFAASPTRDARAADDFVTAAPNSEGEAPELAPERPTVRITLDLPEDLHMRLKMRAVRERTPMSKLLRAWIDDQV